MPKYIDWLIPSRLNVDQAADREFRAQLGRLEGWVSIGVNTLLFVTKLLVGLLINSLALIADGFHSFSDVLTSIVVLIGYKISERPGDREHPYGHQRVEYIATLIVAILLCVVGVEFIKQAYERIRNPQVVNSSLLVLLFIILTIITKWWLGNYSQRLGQLIKSDALKADAFHHYSDSASSVLVLISMAASSLGFFYLDGITGLLIGIILIYGGFVIAKGAADTLVGKPPTAEQILAIRNICRRVPDVIDAHDIIVHSYGERLFVSVHIEIDQHKSSLKAHAISDAVEKALLDEMGAHATIHIDPIDRNSEIYRRVHDYIQAIVEREPLVREFHDLRIVVKPEHHLILFDVVPSQSSRKAVKEADFSGIVQAVEKQFPGYKVALAIDPVYIFN